ncbi:RNA polymerase sigma factor [Haloferula sp. A504]|uniref:RNA polymerase sigma factor n=1 Tax=Haloferula sp. A504 TaxID=3373601 RepID=UPI0031CB2940|nr:sigma-70 family RNA polymerase sigma factor [Verrucomicrobiaceae bacterium E54]
MIDSSIPDNATLPVGRREDERTEAATIKAARGGDDEAFRDLVERHQQRVHRLCYHCLGDEEDAREACQDTFVRAYRALPRFSPRARLSTWLHRIALNLCRDRLRRRRPTMPLDGIELACRDARPDEAVMGAADLARLTRGLAALPPRLYQAIVLSSLEGLSHAECAAIMKCSTRAVEGRLYRARRLLAEWWKRNPG